MNNDRVSISTSQETLPLDVGMPAGPPTANLLFRLAYILNNSTDARNQSYVDLALQLSDRALVATDDFTLADRLPGGSVIWQPSESSVVRQNTEVFASQLYSARSTESPQVQAHVELLPELDLVVGMSHFFDRLAILNEGRRTNQLESFTILCPPVGFESIPCGRPFRLVSVGGTFNNFHAGHQAYLDLALLLADRVHVFISTDGYARPRKDYQPRRLETRRAAVEAHFRNRCASDRVELETLKDVADIPKYVESSVDLDLVLAERSYFGWFDGWNERRKEYGLPQYAILCKPRTRIHGLEVASTMWAKKSRRERAERLTLPMEGVGRSSSNDAVL